MPTLEDTIEFQAATLNDLLDADAKAVALPSEGEGKYRSWAYISSAAAGLLAILLVVALVTKNGGGDGGSGANTEAKTFPGREIHRVLRLTEAPAGVAPGQDVSIYKAGVLVVAPVGLAKINEPKGNTIVSTVEVAMNKEQVEAYNKAFAASSDRGTVQAYTGEVAPAPAAATPDSTAPPATTAETAPPATTTPESTPPASG